MRKIDGWKQSSELPSGVSEAAEHAKTCSAKQRNFKLPGTI
jgi:hypothetical protein